MSYQGLSRLQMRAWSQIAPLLQILNSYTAITQRNAPTHLWRSSVKSDSPDYCFDTNQLDQAEPERKVVCHFRR